MSTDPVVERLIASIAQRGAEISAQELDDFIPFLVLSAGMDERPSPKLLARMDAFFQRASIDPRASNDRIQAGVTAWFAKHPPSRKLMLLVEEIVGGAEVAEADDRSKAARGAIGASTDKRPSGAQGAGLRLGGLAQFALQGAIGATKPPPDVPRLDPRTTVPNADKELL